MGIINFEQEDQFETLLIQLRNQEDTAWKWLLKHLREQVVPYVHKIDGRLRKDAVTSVEYFVEEIFANSLIKFYELFDKGEFNDLGQMRGLMYRIAELKLKEAYRKVDRDVLLFSAEESASAKSDQRSVNNEAFNDEEQTQRKQILQLQGALRSLPELDRQILMNYANGKKLKEIASDLKIKETACRKKKQRALNKLRNILGANR